MLLKINPGPYEMDAAPYRFASHIFVGDALRKLWRDGVSHHRRGRSAAFGFRVTLVRILLETDRDHVRPGEASGAAGGGAIAAPEAAI